MELLKDIIKQPYWVIALILGVILVAAPCVTIDSNYKWSTHQPSTILPVVIGIVLLLLSSVAFWFDLISKKSIEAAGLDMTLVAENKGVFSTTIDGSEIHVKYGRIESQEIDDRTAVVLPCNEYFDDRCVEDRNSALGAYINRKFEGQIQEFLSLMKMESGKRLVSIGERQKTPDERAESFGAGRCFLLIKPLDRSTPIALISTTTQRAGQGLEGRISYLFQGLAELVERLGDARLSHVIMPVLGAGHGGIKNQLAFVGLLLALAEAARHGQGRKLKKATIVIFEDTDKGTKLIDETIVRRALALIGTKA